MKRNTLQVKLDEYYSFPLLPNSELRKKLWSQILGICKNEPGMLTACNKQLHCTPTDSSQPRRVCKEVIVE